MLLSLLIEILLHLRMALVALNFLFWLNLYFWKFYLLVVFMFPGLGEKRPDSKSSSPSYIPLPFSFSMNYETHYHLYIILFLTYFKVPMETGDKNVYRSWNRSSTFPHPPKPAFLKEAMTLNLNIPWIIS